MSEILLFMYFLLPVIFFIRMWKNKTLNFWAWLIETSTYFSIIFCFYLLGGWIVTTTYFSRYFLLATFIILTIKSYKNTKKSFHFQSFGYKKNILYLFSLGICFYFLYPCYLTYLASFCPSNPVELEFPLKNGTYCILHGGSHPIINAHQIVSAQEQALDILKINCFGQRTQKLKPKKLEDYNIYNMPILSPCNGRVIEVVDGFPDQAPGEMDSEHPAGNFLAIEKENSEVIVILAHLKKGSIQVKLKNRVEAGQLLANVGNSGNTSEPHLHIHCVKKETGDYLFEAEPMPMSFKKRYLVRNDLISR